MHNERLDPQPSGAAPTQLSLPVIERNVSGEGDPDTRPIEVPPALQAGRKSPNAEKISDNQQLQASLQYPMPLRPRAPSAGSKSSQDFSRPVSASSQRTPRRVESPFLEQQQQQQLLVLDNNGQREEESSSSAAENTPIPEIQPLFSTPKTVGNATISSGTMNGKSERTIPALTIPATADSSSVHEGRESVDSTDSKDSAATSSSVGWDPGADISTFDAFTSRNHGLPDAGDPGSRRHRSWEDQRAWEQSERERRELETAAAYERANREEMERRAEEEFHRGEAEARRAADLAKSEGLRSQALPLEHGEPAARDGPLRKRTQTTETYEVKHIRWVDPAVSDAVRTSPILVQNANGPCPLVALVNALSLTTPTNVDTGLVETLRVREQVSLGLLLDAVFDELMSGRRGGVAQDLPDVSDLYQFLITLHTGMNVNPQFVPCGFEPPKSLKADEDERLQQQEQQQQQQQAVSQDEPKGLKVGSFEETREMKLYSTFSVPLIHGWLPSRHHAAFSALARSGRTYEDAQNLLFREEELEDKLAGDGLSAEEQLLLQDIATIKYFLSQSATQLTKSGLAAIVKELAPGAVAILFRNDHFSTLYKHPHSHKMMQLVTDMGYAGHEEVVWESLVDVSGEGSEFLSGDFRAVGNNNSNKQQQGDSSRRGRSTGHSHGRAQDDNSDGWVTVETRNPRRGPDDERRNTVIRDGGGHEVATLSRAQSAEQEDRDLALALQLQEEEEDRHRREVEGRRRREQEQQHQQQGSASEELGPSSGRDATAQRGRGMRISGRGQQVRSLIPPIVPPRDEGSRSSGPEAAAPPPSYQQAANGEPFNPSPNHPAHPSSPNAGAYNTNPGVWGSGLGGRRIPRPGSTAQAGRGDQNLQRRVTGLAAGQDGVAISPAAESSKKDCIVM
ncbi:MAG: hypothetical protein M1825_005561 [Sarcosagium campestre]|nr:MAG: hypothetical protein M1825_005561 [Sarcosagium campestre]